MRLERLNSKQSDELAAFSTDDDLRVPNSPLIPIREVKIELPDYLENIQYDSQEEKVLRKRQFTEFNQIVSVKEATEEEEISSRKVVKLKKNKHKSKVKGKEN